MPVRYTTYMNTTPFDLTVPLTNISIKGKQFKVTRLKTAHGSASNRWADRIKGGSSRVRTGAGSRSVTQNTKATALMDVRS